MNRISDYEGLLSGRITSWLTEYLDQSGMDLFVIGVSGGIDSAVSSTLLPVLVNQSLHFGDVATSPGSKTTITIFCSSPVVEG